MSIMVDHKWQFPSQPAYAVEFDQREAALAFRTASGEVLYQTFVNGYAYLVTDDGNVFAVGAQASDVGGRSRP